MALPEVKVGIFPGAGGTQRVPRLTDPQSALQMLTSGQNLSPKKAKQMGLIHEVVEPAKLIDAAKAMIAAGLKPVQPWDEKGFKIPGGDSKHPSVVPIFSIAPAMANQKSHGNYPAITHIMSCVFEGCLVDIDTGLEIESRYFAA